MKKAYMLMLVVALTASLFAGCRNMGGSSTSTNAPTSSSTKPTVVPMPEIPLPSGTNTTSPSGTTLPVPSGSTNPSVGSTPGGASDPEGTTNVPGRAVRPSARGPRY